MINFERSKFIAITGKGKQFTYNSYTQAFWFLSAVNCTKNAKYLTLFFSKNVLFFLHLFVLYCKVCSDNATRKEYESFEYILF